MTTATERAFRARMWDAVDRLQQSIDAARVERATITAILRQWLETPTAATQAQVRDLAFTLNPDLVADADRRRENHLAVHGHLPGTPDV